MDITISSAVIVAIIIGLSQAIKQAADVNAKFIPLIDVALGLALSFGYSFIEEISVPYVIFYGLAMGLTACGLFSGGKNILEGLRKEG